ncbi:outer membrane homotrimeric porin [Pseudodesulfovibrio tunisiensis]|uniref:outer membrane homotrimeric porin n=1 Tax=Pseudodesulfovibrio tunisiensis TaxID=463192 RepID=UPI001FB2EBE6|nr:outer membrane homotrimeric porin [Pseudodesulfovibrio tunisiensis]
MKRLTLLAVLCAFVLGMAASASAAEIKASGSWAVEAVWKSNWQFQTDNKANDMQTFNVKQRATTSFEFIANENLKGVMQLRYGTGAWGNDVFGLGNGDSNTAGTATQLRVRQAYLDFNWPGTQQNIVAGYKSVSLPAMFGGGSYILDEEIATAMVSGPITDNVSYLVGYARAFQNDDENGEAGKLDNVDGYYAALPLSFEGFDIVPFGMYANIGENVTATDVTAASSKMKGLAAVSAQAASGNDSDFDNAWWLGLGFKMDLFDPFVFKADLNYGTVDADDDYNKRAGWLFDAALEYKGFDFMTPEVFFAYTSGEDEADNGTAASSGAYGKSHRMPVLAASNWAVGSFFIGGDTLLDGSINNRNASLGFWTLGVSFKDIASFLDGMSHTVHVLYMQGTNDKDLATFAANGNAVNNVAYGRTLTEDDSLWEVDVNTAYKVYDELTLTLDLGYINMDATNKWDVKDKGGDAWKISTGVLYQF